MSLLTNLRALWHMNNNWQCSAGGYHGTAYGATFGTPKLGAASGSFDGVDDYVAIPPFDVGNIHTLAFWGLCRDASYLKDSQAMGKEARFSVYFTTGLPIKFISGNGAGWSGGWKSANTIITANTFHLGIIVVNGSTENVSFYLNGAPNGSVFCPNIALNTTFWLGGREGASAGYRLNGLLDEVAFWNRALTAEEALELYNGGAGIELGGGAAVSGRRRRMMAMREAMYV
ncbi:MAG: LamG domain-containing protein [Thermodesulfovibrionales bacterium]|nr:LamG domain-containing protein [Thermodesulfovibrionales bacterium]